MTVDLDRVHKTHIPAGDEMQSALSRIVEWAEPIAKNPNAVIPYEVRMAIHEARRAIDNWTDARSADGRSGSLPS